jgi:hypothetical protein
VGAIGEVADPLRRFKSSAQHVTAGPYVFHPARDDNHEDKISACLKAP